MPTLDTLHSWAPDPNRLDATKTRFAGDTWKRSSLVQADFLEQADMFGQTMRVQLWKYGTCFLSHPLRIHHTPVEHRAEFRCEQVLQVQAKV